MLLDVSTIPRIFSQRLLSPEDLAPSREDLEVIGVFNPGAVQLDGQVVLVARVAERPRQRREGYVALPRWRGPGELTVDWLDRRDDVLGDPRKVVDRRKVMRLKFVSHLRVFHCDRGKAVIREGAHLMPEGPHENYGIEDPRITRMAGSTELLQTHVAVSEHGAGTALTSTEDLKTFHRRGLILAPENKDVVLFPRRFDGQYLALHRPNTFQRFCKPEVWLARSPDLVHWGRHQFLWGGRDAWESDRVGAGPPPILTRRGWLLIYHGGGLAPGPGQVGAYSAGLLLLDSEDPARVIAAGRAPFMEPQQDWELQGYVPGVVFPTGAVLQGDMLLVYYGAADTHLGLAGFSLEALLETLVEDLYSGFRNR